MRFTPRILAIDYGATHVACGWFASDRKGRLTLRHYATAAHETMAGEERPGLTAGALGGIEPRRRRCGVCVMAVPGRLTLVKFVRTPAIGPAQRGPVIAFEAGQNIPYPLSEVVWDWLVVGEDGGELELMLAAVKAGAIGELLAATEQAGFAPTCARPDCLALRDAYRYNYPEGGGRDLMLQIGDGSTHLLFPGPGERFFVRTLPIAGGWVTRALAAEMKMDPVAAETLKRQVLTGTSTLAADSSARAAVGRVSEHFMARLQLEVARTLFSRARQADFVPPARILLAGGGARMPGLAEYLQSKLHVSVAFYDAGREVELSPQAMTAGATEAGSALPILIGLAAGQLRTKDRPFNLMPASVGDRVRFRRRLPWWLAAAALLVISLVPPARHYQAQVHANLAAIAKLDAELARTRLLAAQQAEIQTRLDQIQEEAEAYRKAAAARTAWIGFFAGLQANLLAVEDVWLDRLQVVGAPSLRAEAGQGNPAPPLQLAMSGRLLDLRNPRAKVGADAYGRVKALMAGLAASPHVAGIEEERFDSSQPGVLRFGFTIITDPRQPL